jgi:hypothetical protein
MNSETKSRFLRQIRSVKGELEIRVSKPNRTATTAKAEGGGHGGVGIIVKSRPLGPLRG